MKQNIWLVSLLIIGIEVFGSDPVNNKNRHPKEINPTECPYLSNSKFLQHTYSKHENRNNSIKCPACCIGCCLCSCACLFTSFLYITEPKKIK